MPSETWNETSEVLIGAPGQVVIVFGCEISRLARKDGDWYHLMWILGIGD